MRVMMLGLCALTLAATLLVQPAAAVAEPTGAGNVVTSWENSEGRTVYLRETPLSKLQGHNLAMSTARRVTQLTKKVHESGTAYRYQTDAKEYSCGWWNCTTIRQQPIRVVVDERVLRDGKELGVVTAYCPGAGQLCPDWVNDALNG